MQIRNLPESCLNSNTLFCVEKTAVQAHGTDLAESFATERALITAMEDFSSRVPHYQASEGKKPRVLGPWIEIFRIRRNRCGHGP